MPGLGSVANAPAALLKGVSGELEALRSLPGILGELAGAAVGLTRSAEQSQEAAENANRLLERHHALFDDFEGPIRDVRLRIESFLEKVDTDRAAERVEALLDRTEALLERLPTTLDRGDALVDRAPEILDGLARTTDRLDALVDRLDPLLNGAEPLLESAGPLVQRAGPLLDSAEPLLGRAEPALEDLKATRTHVASMDESMDTLVERMAGFDDSITELEQTVTGMPGAKLAKRRGKRHDGEDDDNG